MDDTLTRAFREAAGLAEALAVDAAFQASVAAAADRALATVRAGRTLLFAGNGGSAADAQHMAAEYVGRFKLDRPGLPAIALTADSAVLTALGNDLGFETLFARQVEALGRPGDLLFLSSTSGRSPNVLRALAAARAAGVGTVLLTGAGYLPAPDPPDILLAVPSRVTARIQEAHLLIGHAICESVERRMFGS